VACIRKAQTAFSALNKIWQSTYSTQTKLRIFNTNVKAVLLYGCETWKNLKYITTKLQVFINKSLRKILRIFWPEQVTNNKLWNHTKQPRIELQIRKRKWGWLGHTLREPMEDITRQALDWNPQGKWSRGRPKNTWQRKVLEETIGTKKAWAEIKCNAKNRVRWRILVDTLCSAAEWWDYWLISIATRRVVKYYDRSYVTQVLLLISDPKKVKKSDRSISI
jgi:hypothetical protein